MSSYLRVCACVGECVLDIKLYLCVCVFVGACVRHREIKEREREFDAYLKQMRQYIPAVDRRDHGSTSKPGEFTR